MRILGIDPGSRRTGYGLIEATPQHNRYLSSGCIRLPESKSLAERLVLLGDALGDLIQQWQPDCGVVEEVFFAKHPRSALCWAMCEGLCYWNWDVDRFVYMNMRRDRSSNL